MDFKISEDILEKYPDLRVGVLILRGIDNRRENSEIQDLIRELVEEKRKQTDSDTISEIPIIARWREVYKSFGAKPSDYRNSAEALLKRILRKDLYKINPLVDIYNYLSIKYTLTVGGEDLDKMKGDLVLDFANGDESFIPLGEKENSSPWKGEVVYKDDNGVVCRCWNWREGDRTKLTEGTKNAVVVVENIIPEDNDKLDEALEELKQLILKYCGGKVDTKMLDKDNNLIEI